MTDAHDFPFAVTAPDSVDVRPVTLIPHDNAAGRSLTAVIAILTFLACLCAGGAVWLAASTAAWRSDVAREITIQIKPHMGGDVDAETARVLDIVGQSSAIASARAPSREETEKMLAPWLGSGLDLSQLPIPRLVTATLSSRADSAALAALRAQIAMNAADVAFDDHAVWVSHLTGVGRSLTLLAGFLFVLVVAAIAIAIAFATRAAMAGAREIVEVLHFVGASDGFITQNFQRYFFLVSARGTGVGGAAALFMFLAGEGFAHRGDSADGAAMTVLLGSFHLPLAGYLAILGVCVALVAMAGLFSRRVAAAQLRVFY
jgi:cell division transport system permease protein